MIGESFGPYQVLAKLGEGGMGEVYRARDSRLNRDVALKVLPLNVSGDPERLARFTREAQVLASLNHPNIGGIHGLEHDGGRQALVLELVEGPTLGDRIAQGALPLGEALAIARQVAEALEAAHDHGIVHRDLKPANIKLKADGTVKVLDFGLAKASAVPDAASVAGTIDVTASPTMISPATMTSAGMILGTAAYMSPEQARGKAVDRRTDIWAFGCVLYEMLTGRRTFEGDAVTDTLAGILRGEPDWNALPASTPPVVRRLLRRCLEKDVRQRLQSIGDARIEIGEALASPAEAAVVAPAALPARPSRRWVALIAVGAMPLAAVLVWMLNAAAPASERVDVTRSLLSVQPFDGRPLPKDGRTLPPLPRPDRTAVAISPDGRTIVQQAVMVDVNPGGGSQTVLLLRRLDSLDVTPLRVTTGSNSPFFSPKGDWIGYWDAGELRRVPASGTADAFTTIARVPDGDRIEGASWGDNDVIVFATGQGVWRVPASGGTPERIVAPKADESARRLPQVLPGSSAVIFTMQKTTWRWDDAQVMVRALDTGDEKVLVSDAADARYVTSGHLVFMQRGKLMAAPFDRNRLELTGGAVAIVDDVMQAANMGNSVADSGAGQFAVSSNGTLIYVTGGMTPDAPGEVVWVDRATGMATSAGVPQGKFGSPRLSPDGRRILMFSGASVNGTGNRVWVYDVDRHTHVPVSPRDERVSWGAWSPDGKRIVYQNLLAGRGTLYAVSSDGTGKSEAIGPTRQTFQSPGSWSSTGALAFTESSSTTGTDIHVVDMTSTDHHETTIVQTAGEDSCPEFSPDGKWLAYASNESGRFEVYVQPYPGPGPRVMVSTDGGYGPTWRADGHELYFYVMDGGVVHMQAAAIAITGATLSVGQPQQLFEGQYGMTSPVRGYDVSPDGKRFMFVRRVTPPAETPQLYVLVQNWFEELRRRVK